MCLLSSSDMRKKIGGDSIFDIIKTVDLENLRVAFIIRKLYVFPGDQFYFFCLLKTSAG